MPAIITSSAGPLCVSHSDAWKSVTHYTQTDTFIRLSPPSIETRAVTATVLVSLVKRDAPTELFLHEVFNALKVEHGVYNLRINFQPGEDTASLTYKLAIADTGEPGQGDLQGLVVIRKYHGAFTRFDFVASEAYYQAHYNEALIMSSAVDYIE